MEQFTESAIQMYKSSQNSYNIISTNAFQRLFYFTAYLNLSRHT